MPLSEQEQRLLDEMERSLYHHDADDVAKVGARGRASYTAIALAIVAAVIGIVLLIAGVIVQQPLVGLLGFVVMFVGALLGFAPPRGLTLARDASEGPRRAGFMDTLSERWDQRRDPED
ncbi:DUF3040 domain-containing protein [Pseudolysinimonas sp.]|uniref:DUF3040 domain-containing protein n=1 Tax=Pseudolysinimonas sp. TaxID=2680009 RepID=UPI00286ADC92|nr:DUF3040 domain-containing protein [Pseudolysinimonas sp.]